MAVGWVRPPAFAWSFVVVVLAAVGCSDGVPDSQGFTNGGMTGSNSGDDDGGAGSTSSASDAGSVGSPSNQGGQTPTPNTQQPSATPDSSTSPDAQGDAAAGSPRDAGGPPEAGGGSTIMDAATATDASNGFDQFQQHNLDVLNQYRAMQNIAPLKLDATLSVFALAGTQELTQDHTYHLHIMNVQQSGSLQSAGFNTQWGENQGDANGWPQVSQDPTMNELGQIDAQCQYFFNEGPGSGEPHAHYTNMMDPRFTRVGIGLLEVSGLLYLTNDFSN